MAAEIQHQEAPRQEAKLVQRLLQTGLAVSTLLMAAGLIVQLVSNEQISIPVRLFDVATLAPIPLGERLMALGIVVLAFTPAFRVLTLLGLWLRERDYRFVIVAIAVVLTLALAIAVGGG